jgi:hypothetical protein
VIFMAGGTAAMDYYGQTNSLCGSIIFAAGARRGIASFGYHGGTALVALGAVLLVGAFILSLRIEPWSERRREDRAVEVDRGVRLRRRDRN